jgi:rubrerythrin
MYTIKLYSPEKTLAGKTAQSRKYAIYSFHGNTARTMSLPEFCREQDLSLSALARHLSTLPDGQHEEAFTQLVHKMKSRKRGNYARQGVKYLCPSCGNSHTKTEFLWAKRRAARDASPVGSVLRARSASYYGEAAGQKAP